MIIQPNSAADAAQVAAETFSQSRQNQAAGAANPDAAASGWSALTMNSIEESAPMDEPEADRLMQSLTANMFDSPAAALSAHSGLNPQSVFDLLN